MAALTREQILGIKPKLQELEVPEWGGHVYLRPMNPAIAVQFSERLKANNNDSIGLMVLYSVCDSEGNRFFTEEDLTNLAEKDLPGMNRIAKAAVEINGFSTKEIEAEKKD